MTTRAVTVGELALLRGAGQHSETYLWVHNPATVFSARVNQTNFAEPVIAVTYDGGAGSYGDVLPGMTVRIGSTAGADDLGKTRIRKAASATVLYLGAMGGIAWADNAYLTVVNDFELWWKRAVLQLDETYLLDEEIHYSDQHLALDPVPVMGCDAAAWLVAGSAVVTWHGEPWVLGSTISGHTWSVTPAAGVTVTNGTTANASMTFTAAGTYRVAYTVTAANGKSVTGYRFAYIFDAAHPPLTKFKWEKISGERESGGYSTSLEVWDQAGLTQIRPGARVLMFARDYFGSTQQALGPLAGRENVLLAGWIDGEVLRGDPRLGSVRFNVSNAGGLLRKMTGQPVFCKDTNAAPERWTRFEGLTLDHFLWHLCHWRSTVDVVMDVFLSGDTRKAGEFATEADMLWEKIYNVSQNRLVARPGVNRYGQLLVRREAHTLNSGERAALVTVRTLEAQDWEPPVEFERATETASAGLEISGFAYNGRDSFQPLYSRAPGTVLLRTGAYEARDNLMLIDQADTNALAGRLLAQKNNPYPSIPVVLKANDRFLDCMEPAYVAMNLAAGDTPRGVVWTGQKLIVTRMEMVWNAESGRMHSEIECEAEAIGTDGVTVMPPKVPTINIKGGGPNNPFLPFKFPRMNWGPSVIKQPGGLPPEINPPVSGCLAVDGPANGPWDTWMRGSFTNDMSGIFGLIPAIVRAAGVANPSKYVLRGKFYTKAGIGLPWVETLDDAFYTIYDIDNAGNRLEAGIKDGVTDKGYARSGTWGPLDAVTIGGVELVFNNSGTIETVGMGGGMQTPQAGLGSAGVVTHQDWSTIATGYRLHLVLNATFSGYANPYGHLYHEGYMAVTFAPGFAGNLRVKTAMAEFGGWNMETIEAWYQIGSQPEVQFGPTANNVGSYAAETSIGYGGSAPRDLVLRFKMTWLNENFTSVWRGEWIVDFEPSVRIDVESLALYNVCRP